MLGAEHFGDVLRVGDADSHTGTLRRLPAEPFRAGANPRAIAIEPSGRFAYVANAASNDISSYSIDPDTGKNPRALAIDRRGMFVYCTNYSANTVSAYRIDPRTGALSELSGSPQPTGDGPFGIAIF